MTNTQIELIRIVYFSRNDIAVSDAEMSCELDRILNISRINNTRDDVTGALTFNSGVFGQVLEGPSEAVENAFERIQMDDRHSDVTLLEIVSIVERGFSKWSMGFVGKLDAQVDPENLATTSDLDISLLSGQEIYRTLHTLMLKNENAVRAA